MGWKSTIDMTREAMERAVQAEIKHDFSNIPDDVLADMLEALLGGENHGHNYRVVPPGYEDK